MKRILLLLVLLITNVSFAQFAVSKNDSGKLSEFEKERFERFKTSTTIFVLSNVYSKEQYETILNETWTVTPFKVVSANDFDYLDYLNGDFSFAHLQTKIRTSGSSFFVDSFINFYLLDTKEINEKLPKTKNKQDKIIDLVFDNIQGIGRIALFSNTELLKLADKNNGSGGGVSLTYKDPSIKTYSKNTKDQKLKDYHKEMISMTYDNNSFKNYSLGYLKNYFKYFNDLLVNETFVWLYNQGKTQEIKKLKTETLYIPDFAKVEYRPGKIKDEDFSEEDIKKMMSPYKYKYEFISKDELDAKIMNNEEVYYFRYVKLNSDSFIQIVNSKTGDVIYKNYKGVKYNLKDKDFIDLVKAINTK